MKSGKIFLTQLKTLSRLIVANSDVIWISGIYFKSKGGYAAICVPFIKEGAIWEFVISGPDGGYIEHKFEDVLSIDG